MPQIISAKDPLLAYEGAVDLQYKGPYVAPWRVPYREAYFFLSSGIGRAAMPSGVRLTFKSNTSCLAGVFEADPPPPSLRSPKEIPRLDLCIGNQLIETIEQGTSGRFQFSTLPPGDKTLALWLPHYNQFRLHSLEISDGATLLANESNRSRWIIYGNSVDQGRGAASPARTWPALVSRHLDLHLTSLASGIGCLLQPMFALLMRDLPVDLMVISVGGSICSSGSLNIYTFRPALLGFVRIIREKQPQTPIILLSPIYTPSWEERPAVEGGLSIQTIREEIHYATTLLRDTGDSYTYYLNGLELFGPEHRHLFIEQEEPLLHPNAEGYQILAENFERWLVSHSLFPLQQVTDHP
ncbi:G-D-S-L family lipolytic protein [Ktedonosporobacter rubrisoli]|uniref:G-D-S-L family lipolytic protein n=1 Tax=Ktedonosporobacter rubrisoli TaxID=2509675 RepID=A0A4P6JPC2_KTERU|nr:SGNH/GDSL hydrolase family protein [Ktedonosporobacter rubrisoli]QBD77053.1 G-D-S-L family lipolytic protein [Ktedonosporobacter rubrisoli]